MDRAIVWENPLAMIVALFFFLFIEFAPERGDETGLKSQLISTPSLPTQPMKGCTTPPGPTPPTLYKQQYGFFSVPKNQNSERAVRRGLRFFVLIRKD